MKNEEDFVYNYNPQGMPVSYIKEVIIKGVKQSIEVPVSTYEQCSRRAKAKYDANAKYRERAAQKQRQARFEYVCNKVAHPLNSNYEYDGHPTL